MHSSPVAGGNLENVKRQNRYAVLRVILGWGPISRQEICGITGLTPGTVTHIVTDLLREGIVQELGYGLSEKAGRKRVLLDLCGDAGVIGAVDIRLNSVTVALANLRAELCSHPRVLSLPLAGDPMVTVDAIEAGLRSLLSECGFNGKLLGVGVGAVGLVDYETGVNRVAPGLGWHDVPLRDALRQRLGVPVTVDNNVRAMTLGEKLIGLARDVADFILIYIGWGVGSGLVIHHQLYRGNGFYAGEVGHMMVDPEGLPCVCGNVGCLQTVASGMALVEAARRSAIDHPESSLSALVQREDFSLETIAGESRRGDSFARILVRRSAETMGIAVANLVNAFNPGLVVLAGALVSPDGYYLGIVDEIVQRRSFVASSAGGTPVVATSLGPSAGVRGAAALALDHYFYSNPSN